MRIVISDPKTGKSYQAEIPSDREFEIVGKKIGEVIDGSLVEAGGYKLELTGGSDGSGFPMRPDVKGGGRKKVLITKGVAFSTKRKGERKRRYVLGDTYSAQVVQVNAKIAEYGPTSLDELLGKKEEKKEEKK